jgi:hypothetical protein
MGEVVFQNLREESRGREEGRRATIGTRGSSAIAVAFSSSSIASCYVSMIDSVPPFDLRPENILLSLQEPTAETLIVRRAFGNRCDTVHCEEFFSSRSDPVIGVVHKVRLRVVQGVVETRCDGVSRVVVHGSPGAFFFALPETHSDVLLN